MQQAQLCPGPNWLTGKTQQNISLKSMHSRSCLLDEPLWGTRAHRKGADFILGGLLLLRQQVIPLEPVMAGLRESCHCLSMGKSWIVAGACGGLGGLPLYGLLPIYMHDSGFRGTDVYEYGSGAQLAANA